MIKFTISILTGIIGSIVAHVIISNSTNLSSHIIFSISFGLFSIYMCIIYYLEKKKTSNFNLDKYVAINEIGLKDVYTTNKPTLLDYLNETDNSFYFFGISAKRTTSTPELQQKLIELGRKDGDIRFLLFNPNGPNLKRKAQDEGDNWQSWEKEISATIERLKSIAKSNNIKIQIRLYDQFPVWRQVIIDRKKIYLNYFLSGKQGPQSPLLEITSREDSLFWPYYLEFREIWDNHSVEA